MNTQLGGRIECVRGVTYKASVDLHPVLGKDSVVLLRANNIQDGKINFDDVQYVDISKVKQRQMLRKGDILICASSGSKSLVGKAALVTSDLEATFGAFCCVVRPLEIDAWYLGHYFQSKVYRKAIEEACTGTNINNLKPSNFQTLIVPTYSQDVQRRIALRLDSVRAEIDQAHLLIEKLDELVKSRFSLEVAA